MTRKPGTLIQWIWGLAFLLFLLMFLIIWWP